MKTSIALAGLLMACASLTSAQAINGAGATFPYPIYGKWFEEFRQKNPSVEINYQSKGSGAGIAQLTAGTVDFGASDMPMKDEQIAALKVKALHFPTVLGGLVPTYNLPGLADLKFSSEMLAGIFLGKIAKWNDAKIAKANPGIKLPAPTSSWCIVPMAVAPLSCSPIIFRRSARNGKPVRERIPPSSGRPASASRETKASREW